MATDIVTPPDALEPQSRVAARRRQWQRIWRRYRGNLPGMLGLSLLGVFVAMALIYPILLATVWPPAVYDPETGYDFIGVEKVAVLEVTDPETEILWQVAQLRDVFIEPGETVLIPTPGVATLQHPLGLDPLGRDVLSMLLGGAAPAIKMGFAAAFTTAIVGLTLAAVASYRGGLLDWATTHLSDALLLLPAPILMVILGTSPIGGSIGPVTFGIIYGVLVGASATAIILRSHAKSILQRPFIDAARTSGASGGRIMAKELLPHLLPLASIYMFIGVTGVIVADAFISFLAYGNTRFSWGTMLYFAISFPSPHGDVIPWKLLIAGGVAVSLFAAAFYMIAVGLRAATDADSETTA